STFSRQNLTRIEICAGMPAEAFRALGSLLALTEVIISPDNPYVKMSNGLVLTADGTETVGNIGNLTEVVMPDRVTSIRENYMGFTILLLMKTESLHIGAGISDELARKILFGAIAPGATEVLKYITVS